MNKLILGDNLEILKQINSESIDLVYLDPPFFSNRNYEVIWGDEGEIRSFQDRWSGGMDHYIAWLKERTAEMHRILKNTGSIFLHCDWHANAYIRVEILDKIFGLNNLRNEIIWKRAETIKGNFGQGKKSLDYNTDTIFHYSKSTITTFNQPFKKYEEKYLEQFYKYQESDGRKYRLISMIGPGGESKGNPQYEFLGVTKFWRYSKTKMQELFDNGMIIQTNPGTVPQRKQYLDECKGVAIQNLWDDVFALSGTSKEAIGYPTQKPEALLDRIIKMASNEGDTVLDPFVGGGTTIAVAEKLNRNWIGIDQSVQAVKVTEFRLNSQQNLFSQPFIVQLHKYDYDTLRYKDAFEFESWIITQYEGQPQNKKGGDKGIDGKTKDGSPIQVKRSDDIGRNVIDNFLSAIQRDDKRTYELHKADNKPVGYIIAFSFGKGAIQEVARLKNQEDVIIKLVRVDEIVPIAKKPTITVEVNEIGRDKKDIREIEFTAEGQSPAGIEFFSWDFDYNEKDGFKPEIIIDKIGKQQHKFKAGQHIIAVKVVDNDGLDNIELIKLKVNGKVERK
ncbi:MAG: site-specific DNA-methyltransferase [Bacteroidetes bacterium]|nr:site-specific DNA-methyltransferase [Bacteroidota bacterium]